MGVCSTLETIIIEPIHIYNLRYFLNQINSLKDTAFGHKKSLGDRVLIPKFC